MENFKNEFSPDEIINALVNLVGGENVSDDANTEMIDTMYNLLAIAQNPFNREGYRMVYKVLENITERYQSGDFDE